MGALTLRECLRNVLRRTGRQVPPSPESIAAPLTNEELIELVDELEAIWLKRRVPAWQGGGLT